MTIKVSGRSALILAAAAGIWACYAGPSQAAVDTDGTAATAKHATHHWKKYAHHRSSGVARHSATGSKAADAVADDSDTALPMPSTTIPPSVANANAQLASPDTPAGSAQAMSARANDILAAVPTTPVDAQPATDSPLPAADQLNDVDRMLHAGTPPATSVVMASADTSATPAVAAADENSTWDQTSLIGKIFIGFGALLTMASAARMFMA
jgi:hypothetical protein